MRAPRTRPGTGDQDLTHASDHESPGGPRRPPASSPPVVGGSHSASGEPPSRPPAQASRSRAAVRRLATGSLLVVAGLLGVSAAAQAQITYVSNIGQTVSASERAVGVSGAAKRTQAQPFATGDNEDGYTLSEVVVKVGSDAGAADVPRVSIYSRSAGHPGTSLYTLANPVSFASGDMIFSAPPNATLAKGTNYFVVVEETTGSWNLKATASDSEGTVESGWSIGDRLSFRDSDAGAWSSNSRSLLITIKGTSVPGAPTSLTATASGTSTINLAWNAPSNDGGASISGYRIEVSPNGTSSWIDLVANTGTTATTYSHTGLSNGTTRYYRVSAINATGTGTASGTDNATTQAQTNTLVSNTGQTASSNWTVGGSSDWVHAQGFTTGDDADGYTLFSVQVRFGLGSVAVDAVRVSIYGADESGNPSSSLYELTNPSSIVASGLNTFTAPMRPTLEKETEYFIVVEATTGSFFVSSTLSDAEDDGAASGWSINDDRHRFSSGSWSLFTTALPIAVMGTIGEPTPVTIEAQHDSIGGGLEDLLFTLTREGETTDELDVTVTITQEQSWLSNLDFTVTFPAGLATATLPIGASNFSFTPSTTGDLTARVSGDGIDGGSDTVEIISTSGPPITISYEESEYTFAENATDAAIYVLATLDAAYPRGYGPSRVLSVAFSSRTGTAESPEDYAAISWNAILFGRDFERAADTDPLVAREAVPDFAIVNDDIYEGSESFVMYIEAAPGLTAGLVQFADPDGNTCTGTSCAPEYPVTITDEGDLPELSLSVDPSSIAEEDDDGTAGVSENVSTVTVEITNGKTFAVAKTVTLNFSGTATQGIHYSVSPGDADTNTAGHQVVLPKETASVEVTVTATTNSTADGPRTVTVAAYLDGTAIGSSKDITILDDDTTTPALVSNTGQDRASTNWTVGGGPNFVHAQGFTTGDDADGYALFSVQVYFRSGFDSGDEVKVSIYGADESGNPNSSLHELTNPSSIGNNRLNTFTAPTRPTLAKETEYFIVVEAPAGSFWVGSTISDDEDDGAASGWSINDDRRRSDSGVWSSISDPLPIAVMGTIGVPTAVTIEAQHDSIGGGLEDLLFTLTREGETTDELDVTVTITQEQSWLSNLDFTVTFLADSATATLPIGASDFSFTPSTTGDLTARVSGDGIDGGSETVEIISTSGPPITISYEESAYTFAEDATDEAVYALATLDAAYPRGYGPSRVLSVAFSSRTGTAESPEDYAAISWNAILFGSDFERAADTDPLVAREAVPDFAIVNDDIYEGSESFEMYIEAAPGLTAGLVQFADPDGNTCTGTSCAPEYPVTITDEEDLPELSLSVDPSSIAEEDDDGTTGVTENVSTVTVRITNAKTYAEDQTVTLTFSGDATEGTHYSVLPVDADADAAGHQVDLMVGKTAQVTVTATGNDTADGPRTVTVAAYLDETAIGSRDITILDDETTTLSTDATLSGLEVVDKDGNAVVLDPTFVSDTRLYTATVAHGVDHITIIPTLNDINASYEIQGKDAIELTDADDVKDDFQVALDVGYKEIRVAVTAEDGIANQAYRVDVSRALARPRVTPTEGSTTSLDVRWTAPADATDVGYDVQYREGDIGSFIDGPQNLTGTGTSIPNLMANTSYQVQVRMTSVVGDSEWSANGRGWTHPPEITVLPGWNLLPAGLAAGAKFRLLYVSHNTRWNQSTIDRYHDWVQAYAAADNSVSPAGKGHMDIRAYASAFRAVGCGKGVNARVNTGTQWSTSDRGVPIFWLGGLIAADDYGDFYDGAWQNEDAPRTEEGELKSFPDNGKVFTGCEHNGDAAAGQELGASPSRIGTLNNTSAGPLSSITAGSATFPIYGLSQVFVVGDATLSTDATLSNLELEDFNGDPITLNETFASTLLTYTASVTNADTQIDVLPTRSDANATIEYLDGDGVELPDADPDLNNFQVDLDPGDNVIQVKVTAEDGSTTETYTVTVTREGTTDTPVTIEAEYESIGAGLEDLLFTLTREGETTEALDVKVTIDQDQSWLSNIEYTVTFSANSATAELTITKSNFSFTPSTAGNLTATVSGDDIDGGSDTVQIISTSEPPFTASYDMPAYTFAEDATDKAIYLVVTLDAAYPRAVAIDAGSFSSRSGTATSPEDFATYSNQHVVSPGEFTRDVDTDPLVARSLIPDFILPDDIYEGSESFGMKIEAGPGLSADLLQFAYPDGTTCAPYSCSPGVEYPVTITDEGDLPDLSLSVDPSSIAEEDDDGTAGVSENVSTVTVEITNGKTFAVAKTVTLTFSGDATQDTHYSVLPADADTNAAGHQVVLVKETASVEVTVTATTNSTADGPRTVTVAADLDGTAIGSSTITILDDETTTTTAPAIVTDGVKVTSTPATGDTYRLGETIEITVTFDNAVTVNTSGGTPRIELLLGSGNKWAEYSSGSGETALEFTYDVQSGDMDADGISIEADRLQLRGGTITAAADNTVNAFVYYDALGTQTDHKVDGSTVPGAPTSLTATASGTSTIDLSWTAPSSDGGSAITGYRIEVSSDGGSSWISLVVDTDDTNTTYEDRLPAGTTRHYRVSAINANGTGTASNVDNATTTTTVPGAPTSLTATASGTTAIDLSWTAPSSDGGSAITGYRIEVSSDGGSSWNDREANTGSTTTTYSHTGLSAGTTRHYRVSAINSVGTGAASNTANATTDAANTVPGAPTGLSATADGTGEIDLSWDEPADDGGSAITGYRIEFSSDGGNSWNDRVANTGNTSTTYAHTGLDAGTTRHYRVSAINSVGTGAASNTANATTDAANTVPGAPTGLSATADGTSEIDLSWDEPADDGGSAITGYRIEFSSDGGNSWNDRVANTGNTSTTYAHTGLDAGTTRHYRVSAINSVGTGAASNTANATTDAANTVPGAPTGLSATADGTSEIDLSWDEPADDGGSAITGYRIEFSSDGGNSWNDRVANTGNTATTHSHTGLAPGTTRHYRVSAINANGTGAASNVDDATTDDAATTVPGAPTDLTATADGTSTINLNWTAPADNGGSAITGYRIEVSPNGSSGWSNRFATSTSYSHTGLSAGTTRYYRVSALNANGTGAVSNIDNAMTDAAAVPGAPTDLSATADGTSTINLNWTAPSDDGGASISGYKIEVSSNGGANWTDRFATRTSYSHTGLSAGTTRHYRVSAINSVGTGNPSNTANATTEDDDQPGLAVVTVHALATSVSVGGTASFELRRSGGDMDWLKVSYRHEESDGNYVESWGYFKPGDTKKKADYTVGSSGTVTARVTGPSNPLCTVNSAASASCTDDYEVGNPSSASMPVTASASSSYDELEDALILVDDLTPDVAAAVLLGEQTLGEAELAALDRLGNGNGRYDLGDLLSWIDRCRRGEAHCGRTSTDSGPPSAAGLLAAAAAGRPWISRRTRRRGSGRQGRKPIRTARRRGRFAGYALATLLAVTLTLSCTEGSVAPPAYVPDPGFLTVEWSGPATHRDVGVLLELEGPTIDAVRAPGLELYESSSPGPRRIVVAGVLRPGPLVQFRVPDRGQFALYRIRVLEVTGEGYGLRDPTEYRAVVIMH